MMINPLIQECLTVALPTAKRAGEAILSVYEGDIDVTYKEDKSPLTLADEKAHAIIVKELSSEALKHIPILSEEGKQTPYKERKAWEYFWLVDPLDGTKEFINRRGEFTVNIALIHKHRPVLGVVFVPAREILYFAAEGLGSYMLKPTGVVEQFYGHNAGPTKESKALERVMEFARRLPLDQPGTGSGNRLRVVGSRSHPTKSVADFVQTLEEKYGDVEFVPAGSALKFCSIAEGSADIYPRLSPTMEWDTAAGQCVVEKSGGVVLCPHDKTPLYYNKKELLNPGFICIGKPDQTPRLFENLLSLQLK